MSDPAPNAFITTTNVAAAATNLGSAAMNAAVASTNLAGTMTDSANATVAPLWCLFSSSAFTVVFLMAAGVILGSVGSFCYQRTTLASDKARDKWELLKILGMGTAAVALVPAFLRTVSSNLIAEVQISFEAKLVFVAFCVAATLAAKKFIGTLPEKLLNLVDEAKKNSDAAITTADKTAEVVANRTAVHRNTDEETPAVTDPLIEIPPGGTEDHAAHAPIRTTSASPHHSVGGYDWRALLVVRALLSQRYRQGRTIVGLAMDSGLTVHDVQMYLAQLQNNGHATNFIGISRTRSMWCLTDSGRQLFAGRDLGNTEEVGIE